ncbi:tetratricopeptide repeat protein [Pelagicoccus sp. SDUM812002]|uniref:tetratricopeptide repeat protein n=1 Tax=Pelagicoccus sp. SDUM812002 TaxID=3041266 RepID=UPI00280DF289|nr:tetratricopeptide repeat protein [Pelagicoccus sp. SDUM812002]MDQ8187871.1 tetratricopeptide repeat protein [Pelagicoccus sp. SDUM812002]
MNPKSIATLFLVGITSILLSGCGGSDPASLIQKAEDQVELGKFAEAEILLKNVLREDEKNPQALALVGEIYNQQGRIRDAFQVLTAVKQLNPEDANSLATLASIELAVGMREEALVDARAALEIDPGNANAPVILAELSSSPADNAQTKEWLLSLPATASIHAAIGSLELSSGNTAAASKRFEQAIEAAPDSYVGYAGRFQVLLTQKKQEEAMDAFAQAAQAAPPRSGIRVRYVQYLQQSQGDEAAKTELEEILNSAPDYLPALSLAAELAAKTGNIDESRKFTERALRLDPIDQTALRIKGTLLIMEKKVDEAITHLEKALEYYPDDAKTNYQIALAYLAKGASSKAKSSLFRVVERQPGHFEATALLCTILVQEQDLSGAIVTMEDFLKVNPNSLQGYLLLADVYTRKGENEAALAIYKKLEEAQPNNPQLDYLSGLSHLRGQNRSDARSAFESVLSDNPLHFQSVEQLTALDVGERNYEAALDRIDQTIAASPGTSVLHTLRAQILQSKGDTEAALKALDTSIKLDGNNRTARTLYARILLAQGKEDEALTQYRAMLDNNPDDIEARMTIATLYERTKRFSLAAEEYEQILKVNDASIQALNNLAYLYSTAISNPERAFDLAEKARALSPDNPYLADTFGWILFKRGDYTWAKNVLSDSYRKLQGNAEVAYHLGSALYYVGELEAAEKHLRDAAESEQTFDGRDDAVRKVQLLSIDTTAIEPADSSLLEDASQDGDPVAWVVRAQIDEAMKKDGEALSKYQKALKISSDHLTALLGEAQLLAESGKLERASERVERAAKLKPNNPAAISLQGQIAFLKGDHSRAVNRLSEAARIAPNNARTQRYLALSAFAIGDIQRARAAAAQSLTISESVEISSWLAGLDALQDPDLAPSSESLLPKPIKDLIDGLRSLESENLSDAKQKFAAVLETYPLQIQAKLGMAEILAEDASNAGEVERLADEVRKLDRVNSTAVALQGIAAFQKDKPEQALQILNTLTDEQVSKQSPRIQTKIQEILSSNSGN